MVSGAVATVAAEPTLTAQAPVSDTESAPHLGVMTDLGVPDGAAASLVVRPVRALRLELGVAHNSISPGARAGITWIPFRSWATPTFGVAYGRFFERDANPLIRTLIGDPTFGSPLLERVGYDFANARFGLELGRKHVTFFLHAGVSVVTATIHNLGMAAQGDGSSMVTVSSTDPHVRLISASASLGFIVYLF